MVGKTPQVREIVYNVLDDDGNRTVIAKGATTVDVGDTKELFTRTSNLETLTSATFSNVSNAQSNIISIEGYLSQFTGSTYSPILLALQRDHTNNVTRIENLETDLASNAGIVSGNHSNIITLQTDVEENVARINTLYTDLESNAGILTTLKSAHESNASVVAGNYSNISNLQTEIGLVTNYGDITNLQSDITDLKERVTTTIVRVGEDAGLGTAGGTSISIGNSTGTNIGANSIGIGANSQKYNSVQDGDNTRNSIVINATGQLLNPPRRSTLVVAPIQTDDSNTINIMGYNETTKEIVQSTLLRGIDGNVHATTNISVNNDTILFETNGNGSFGGDIEIAGTLEVGGTSSFTGALQVDDTLEIADTSSFGGDMTIDANAFVYGQSFAMYDGTTENIYIRNDGNASFAEAVTAKNINCNETLDVFNSFRMVDVSTAKATINKIGQSSFAGKMQIQDELVVQGHSSFIGGIKVLSPSTSSFGGSVIVNNTSSFIGVAKFEHNISVTGQEIEMFDATLAKRISISNPGNASFAEAITAKNVNCNETLDVFNSFRMVNGGTAYATINKIGQSSFAGEMQINNTLDVDDTLTIKNDTTTDGKVTINPAGAGETITVQGGIYIRNEGDLNASITRGGEAYFRSSVSSGGPITGTGDGSFGGTLKVAGGTELNSSFIIKEGTTTKASISLGGNASFGGTLKVLEGTELNNSFIIKKNTTTKASISSDGNASFGGTLKVLEGTELNNSFIIKNGSNTKASISSDGNGSFGGTLQVANTTTLGSFLSGTSGSFSSELRASDFIIPSDRRFKTDITHIPNALEKVKQISGCIYTINDKPSVGVIAQEVLKILPETVHTGDDGYYAVSYHGLIGLLIEAVKELSEKVK